MERADQRFNWQAPGWPRRRYNLSALAEPLAQVSKAEGLLLVAWQTWHGPA